MEKRFGAVGLLLLLESLFFGLVLVFLIVENIIGILAVILGTILTSFIIVKWDRLNDFVQALFNGHKKTALIYGAFFVLGLPFILHENPYLIHILFMAGSFRFWPWDLISR